MSYTERNCDICNILYKADNRNLKRGWGLCCSKSCAAKKREMAKPTWDKKTVERNNRIRNSEMTLDDWNSLPSHRRQYFITKVFDGNIPFNILESLSDSQKDEYNLKRYGELAPNTYGSNIISGYTPEGYRIMDGIAYDEWDEPMYNVDFDSFDSIGWDDHK